jgi:hypothetical protein
MRHNPKLDRAFDKLNAIVAAHRAAHGSGFGKLTTLLRQAGVQPADIRGLPSTAIAGLAVHAHTLSIAKAAAARLKPKPAARHERG